MNFVMTGSGRFIEVQGTAERAPFNKEQLDEMAALAARGVAQIIALQKKIVGNLT